MDSFKVILGNLIDNEGLSAATEFLKSVISRIDVEVDEVYRRLQVSGREAFKQVLEKDYEFWGRCEGRWGQGKGYRSAIRDMTDEQIEQHYDAAQKYVLNLMDEEWEQLVSLLEEMLQEKGEPIPTSVD